MRLIRDLAKQALIGLNIDIYKSTPDRAVLEKQLLPWFAGLPGVRDVLFVGCDWYTRGYRRKFSGHRYVTMDYDADKARYGADLHITDSMANLGKHFGTHSVDLIICNGVFGWGLNAREDVESAFAAAAAALRPNGLILLGWNDIPERRPFGLETIDALRSLKRRRMDPLGTDEYLTASGNRHTYTLYERG